MITAAVMNKLLKQKSCSHLSIFQVTTKEGACWWRMIPAQSAAMAVNDTESVHKPGVLWFVTVTLISILMVERVMSNGALDSALPCISPSLRNYRKQTQKKAISTSRRLSDFFFRIHLAN